MATIRLEHIVGAIKALKAAELVLTKDDYVLRAKAQTECLNARYELEMAIGKETVSVTEVQS